MLLLGNRMTGFGAARSGASLLAVRGVDFNGSSQYAARGAGLTGGADGSQGTISFWFRMDGGDGATQHFFVDDGERLRIYRQSAGPIWVRWRDPTGSYDARMETVNSHNGGAGWKHLLASWDLNYSDGNKLTQLYINDARDRVAYDGNPAFNVDYTRSNYFVGAEAGGSGGYLNGCIAELWFAPTRIDLSVEANRRKFISATGKLMDLGATGANPTGAQPIVYQSIRAGGVVNDFLTNRGTGGNFSYTGSPTVSSDNPSD